MVFVGLLAMPFWTKTYDASDVMKVQYGMTEREVEAVLGGSASSSTPPRELPSHPGPRGNPKYWYADAGIIEVEFDANGRVIGATFSSWGHRPNPFRQFLRMLWNP